MEVFPLRSEHFFPSRNVYIIQNTEYIPEWLFTFLGASWTFKGQIFWRYFWGFLMVLRPLKQFIGPDWNMSVPQGVPCVSTWDRFMLARFYPIVKTVGLSCSIHAFNDRDRATLGSVLEGFGKLVNLGFPGCSASRKPCVRVGFCAFVLTAFISVLSPRRTCRRWGKPKMGQSFRFPPFFSPLLFSHWTPLNFGIWRHWLRGLPVFLA